MDDMINKSATKTENEIKDTKSNDLQILNVKATLVEKVSTILS